MRILIYSLSLFVGNTFSSGFMVLDIGKGLIDIGRGGIGREM